jgi:hypothetical protein
LCGEVAFLLVEKCHPLGQRLGGGQHRDGDGVAVGGGPASGQRLDQSCDAVVAVVLAQLGGCGDQQGAELIGGGGVGLDRAAACAQQRPQRGGVGVFEHRKAIAGQGGAGGGVGIQRIGLALPAPCHPVGAADLATSIPAACSTRVSPAP